MKLSPAAEALAMKLSDAGPTKQDAREWLLEVIQESCEEALMQALHPEFGTEWREPDGEIWKATHEAYERADKAEARAREYENSITWDTTCLNCSKLLDKSYDDYCGAEKLRDLLAAIEALTPTSHRGMYGCPDDMFSRASIHAAIAQAKTKE